MLCVERMDTNAISRVKWGNREQRTADRFKHLRVGFFPKPKTICIIEMSLKLKWMDCSGCVIVRGTRWIVENIPDSSVEIRIVTKHIPSVL